MGSKIVLRFRGPDGSFQLPVNDSEDFASIAPRITAKLASDVDLSTLKISNHPDRGDARLLSQIGGVSVKRMGLP